MTSPAGYMSSGDYSPTDFRCRRLVRRSSLEARVLRLRRNVLPLRRQAWWPAPARHYQPELLKTVLNGDINPGRVSDLTTDLDHIADAYAAMDERRAITTLVKVSGQ
jgi:hypothetical protein